ncbi:MAG: protein translocase subunit SecD [Parcubacteria group bacterium CG08_land_8_20_14_0_20_43_9]|nr:MAG: protein translocase subunit SecD [Parcubacteria group bacterium CG08_land_8_20_14_0_20_43_9]
MAKKYFKLISIAVILLSIITAIFIEPKFFNQGVDFLNNKLHLGLPHFWDRPFQLGLDLEGGVELLYEADLSQIKTEDRDQAMQGLRDVIDRRINALGVREPEIEVTQSGDTYRLLVRIPGITDPQQAIKEIGVTPYLEFQEPKADFDVIREENQKIMESGEGRFQNPFQPSNLTGRYLEKATVVFDSTTLEPTVSLEFNEEGAKIFEQLTEKFVGKPLAIFIDNQMLSAPVIREKISGGEAQISGDFTAEEAKTLARNLSAGALPVPVGEPISQVTIGPTLGIVSLQKSITAGYIGFLAIIVIMIFGYRFPGLLAALALLIYGILSLGLFKLIPITLTLAGIGGFILSIGMAVDANILIFARFKEELKKGKEIDQAIDEGFVRAWPSIKDSNITTLIIGLILFTVGTTFVKGFATTLILGIILSILSSVFITRAFLVSFAKGRISRIKWLW